jgi:threonine/homoserine/homoserine lactone efflux protein
MMPLDPTLLVGFVLASAVLALIPGPDTMFVLANAMVHRVRGGIVAACGIGAGAMVHATAAAIGISALIAASEPAFAALRYLGALYLVWIGVQTLRAAARGGALPAARAIAPGVLFRRAAVTNITNVKVIVFYLAMLPQFVDPARGHVWLQMFLLGCIYNAIETLELLGVGMLAGRAAQRLMQSVQFRRALDVVAGTVFVGLGLRLAIAGPGRG